jgi:hypothetical protein
MNKIFISLAIGAALIYTYFSMKKKQDEKMDATGETGLPTNQNYTPMNTQPQTKNFKLSEFKCSDGTAVPQKYWGNLAALMEQLQIIRETIDKPITINSGYRTPTYNKAVGGVANSSHLVAKAADIKVIGISSLELCKIILKLIQEGKIKNGGLGLYDSFIHYDIGNIRRWNMSKNTAFNLI